MNGSSFPASASFHACMKSVPDSTRAAVVEGDARSRQRPGEQSSSDGRVAAVIATVSPSQPRPLVIQMRWTVSLSSRSAGARTRWRSRRPGALVARWTRHAMRSPGPVKHQPVALPADQAALDRPRARARPYGRSAPTSCPISRWVSGRGSRILPRARRSPALGQVPEQEAMRASARGWHVAARWTFSSIVRRTARRSSAWTIRGHGRMPSAKASSRTAIRVRTRAARTSPTQAARRRRRCHGARMSPADQLAGDAIATCTSSATTPLTSSSPSPPRSCASSGTRSNSPGEISDAGRRHRARDQPHPQVEPRASSSSTSRT